MSEQLRADLEAARELIDQPGKWCQGMGHHYVYDDEGGYTQYCIVGAAGVVLYNDNRKYSYPANNISDDIRFMSAIRRAINEVDPGTDPDKFSHDSVIAEWNDALGRTHDEVMDIFDHAIKTATEPR